MLLSQSHPMPIPYPDSHNTVLVSSGDIIWDNQSSFAADAMDAVNWNYYTLPPSPPASVSSNTDDSPQPGRQPIRSYFTPEPQSESEQQPCLPTNQVFDLDAMEPSSSSSASPPPSIPRQLTLSSDIGPSPRKALTTIGVKKGRGNGERITTKDFVPPDVTGLSKREARLLKNRAAAFLSRQRKREEFEAMEIRVKELEEENSQLQALAAKGKKYEDLVASVEQLRVRLSITEKRERELTAELANQTATNMAVKTESHDLTLPPPPFSPYAPPGSASIITIMKQSLLSSIPSLLCLPPQTSLPISFTVPLTGSSPGRPSSSSLSHQVASCDIKDQGRPRFVHGSVEFHLSSADVDSSKMAFGGGAPGARQFDVDGHHCLSSLAISLEALPTEDGQGCVHVQVTERLAKPTAQGSRQRPSSVTSQWSGADPSFGMTCYASPLSASANIPSSGSIDHLGVFTGTGNAHSRMDFDAQLMQSGYPPFAHHDPEPTFDYYPGIIPE